MAIDRTDRLDLLARIIRDRPGIAARDVAEQLGVGVRSVFRDIERLRDRGVPIEASRGRGGGLRIPMSWGLGRILLTTEEALCTLLGLAVNEKLGFPMFAEEVPRARRKVVDAFPQGDRRRLGPLRERVFIGAPASAAVRASYVTPIRAPIRQLQAAFVNERVVRAVYRSEQGEAAERRIEPHALVINWPAWYLIGWDQARSAPRTFRFDRFVSVVAEAESFRPRPRDVAAELLGDPRVALDPL
jgi:predicted DNA-binding transcriptional regulator YafY